MKTVRSAEDQQDQQMHRGCRFAKQSSIPFAPLSCWPFWSPPFGFPNSGWNVRANVTWIICFGTSQSRVGIDSRTGTRERQRDRSERSFIANPRLGYWTTPIIALICEYGQT